MNRNVFAENAPSLRFHVLSFPWSSVLAALFHMIYIDPSLHISAQGQCLFPFAALRPCLTFLAQGQVGLGFRLPYRVLSPLLTWCGAFFLTDQGLSFYCTDKLF
jgi:hypothetical protein